MKRIITIFLVIVLMFTMIIGLTACSGQCEICGQNEKLNTYVDSSGDKQKLCDDCYSMAKFWG